MTTRCVRRQLRQALDERDRPMFPPRTAGWLGSAARSAAASAEVVVLPFVPVTPIVGAGHRRRNEVRLGHERRRGRIAGGARGDESGQGRPQARLGRRVVGVDRRRGRHERRAAPRPSPDRRPGPARSRTGRPSSAAIAVAELGRRPAVVDRDAARRRRRGTGPGRSRSGRSPRTVTGRSAQRAAADGVQASARRGRSSGVAGSVIAALTAAGLDRGEEQGHPEQRRRGSPTIQKRSVIFSSSQPPSSKWWWIGAIRKIRLPPVSLEVADLEDDRAGLDRRR